MNLNELIEELQRKRDVAIEQNIDPSCLSVIIPAVSNRSLVQWEDVVDSEIVFTEQWTMADLQLQGLAHNPQNEASCCASAKLNKGLSESSQKYRKALRVIAKAVSEGADAEFHSARAFLDKHDIYHGDLSGERVLLRVAQVALGIGID